MTDRKPLIILGVLALLAIIAFVVGVLGVGRGDDGGEWPTWAAPDASPGDPLTGDDLIAGPGCSVEGTTITFAGACEVKVRPITGGFPWESATRRAKLVVGSGPVALGVTLAGKSLKTDLDPGDDIRLTYTRDGGSFVVGCANLGGCAVTLLEDA